MATGYYLLDNRNPNVSGDGFHGHRTRNVPMSQVNAVVLHVAVTAPTTSSADNVAKYFATTSRQASYHVLYDSNGRIPLIPYEGTAFHVVGYNSKSIGLSFACNTDTWGRYKNWAEEVYKLAAVDVKDISERFNIPMEYKTRSQIHNGERGFTFHSTMDPSRRTDPGAPPHGSFDLNYLFQLAKGSVPMPTTEEGVSLKEGDKGRRVEQLQHLVNRVIVRTGGWPLDENAQDKSDLLKIDGVYGPTTSERVQHAIWRVERWVLKHPIYAGEDGGSRVTPQTEAWLVHAIGVLSK